MEIEDNKVATVDIKLTLERTKKLQSLLFEDSEIAD